MSVEHSARLKKGYNGELLKMATELGNRLLPAFNSPTGIPYSRVTGYISPTHLIFSPSF